MALTYTETQQNVIQMPLDSRAFLEGPAGSGKTSAALARLERMLQHVPGHEVLILVPQRSLGKPYYDYVKNNPDYRGSLPSILTLGGLAQRMTNLFWPLVAEQAGFRDPVRLPYFLSLETAQYCMSRIVDPKREQGLFNSVTIEKNRIYSQILDNLNKAAVVGFAIDEIAARLKADLNLEPSLAPALDQAQACALDFRRFCFDYNLLDYSLQIEVFFKHVWPLPHCRKYFETFYPHVFFDNIEEDVPAAHDMMQAWLPECKSALLIMDRQAGYRTFLGADPSNAEALKSVCDRQIIAQDTFKSSTGMVDFQIALTSCIRHEPSPAILPDLNPVLTLKDFHFYPEMLAGVADEIAGMIKNASVQAGEIVILAPYLSDALKFSLEQLLQNRNIHSYSSRPSRMYLDEPAVKCVLAFAKLAHPQWEMTVSHFELRDALMQTLPNLDVIRADLIAQTLYAPSTGLKSFDGVTNPQMQARITFAFGEKLEQIRAWLQAYAGKDALPLDIFLSRLFGELLSQKGFGFFDRYEAGAHIAQLINAVKSFRQFLSVVFGLDEISTGIEFIRTVEAGLLPSAFLNRDEAPRDAVLIAPAHAFLMENRAVACQFWLDIGSLGWWERLNQPLTNPYILRRDWQPGTVWSYNQDFNANQEHMQRLVSGLLQRCEKHLYVYSVQTNERGSEQRGPLLQAFQTLRKRVFASRGGGDV